MTARVDASDHIAAFREAMAKEGINYSGPIVADGQFHRVAHDDAPRGKRDVWLKLFIDERPAGMFGYNKLGNDTKFTWTAKGLAPLTDEQRREQRAKIQEARTIAAAAEAARFEAAKASAAAAWDGGAPVSTHPYLAKKGVESYGLRVGAWEKSKADGSSWTAAQDALLIPMRDESKVVWGLQAIFAKPILIGGEDRSKDFTYGARKRGLWFSIGKPTVVAGRLTVLLGEGYATCATIHAATGVGILVCFDAGNLVHVAKTLRRLYPDVRIVICADNDQWTEIRGVPTNVGVEKATEAAKTVDGIVVTPWFSDVNTKPTDFNDLHALAGLQEVARQVFGTWASSAPAEEEPPQLEPHEGGGGQLAVIEGGKVEAPAKKKRNRADPPDPISPESMRDNAWFRILGHDRDMIYIFQAEMKMVVARKNTDWGRNAFLCLANMSWWQQNFPGGGKDGFDTGLATNALIRIAFERGFYDPTKTRGRGAWLDQGRHVYHFGAELLVDGQRMEVTDLKSNYVYEQGRHLLLPPDEPLSGLDGARIIKTAQVFHWTRPASAILLAGWVALAPLCGALRWRPHVWLTGGTGSGKSTILNEFVWFLMNGMEIYAQGSSTEAGIRQTLLTDALPVLFEESEQNDERERLRMQSVLALIRQSSTESGAKTLKGTQIGISQGYMIRSMFCMASVQVGLRHQADIERIAVLSLRPKRVDSKEQAAQNWGVIKTAVDALRADLELPGRLMRRSIQLLPVTLVNIETFAKVAADKFGSQREGDQYGAMLAGAWSLVRSTLVTEEEAREMIGRYDWTDYMEASEKEESSKALETLLERTIRTNSGDVSVYELLARSAGRDGEGSWTGAKKDATAHLMRHGMKIKWITAHERDALFLVANQSSALAELMADTPYASDVKGQLIRVPGARRPENAEKFNGLTSRAVAIPLLSVLQGESHEPVAAEEFDEIPF